MRGLRDDTGYAILLIVLSGIILTSALPYLPIDETRYLTVAWEMKLHDSLILPLLNGLPYPHKPPILFWLINLDWFLLGTNAKSLRFIPLLFSLLTILTVYKMAILLWKDRKIAKYATVILSSTLIYLIWSALIMFDVILTFWVMLGMLGFLSSNKQDSQRAWILIVLSIGGGLLTKGPVIFLHILPFGIMCRLWEARDEPARTQWCCKLGLALCAGIAIAMLWVVPAIAQGGDTYKNAILWGQTAHRMISSFAHQRPVWWYLPWLPGLFFPWILIGPAWPTYALIKQDIHCRFLLLWIAVTILLFGCISGKQIHYLIPILPVASLLAARHIATLDTERRYAQWHYPVATCYLLFGAALFWLPSIKLGHDVGTISRNMTLLPAFGLLLLGGIMLSIRSVSVERLMKVIGMTSVCFLAIIILSVKNTIFSRYDLNTIARILQEKQEDGYDILHYGKYHGEYQFLGRLTRPLVVMQARKDIEVYVRQHKRALLITHEQQEHAMDKHDILYQQPYRGKKIVLWTAQGIHHFLHPVSGTGMADHAVKTPP